jgi:hypothetical protein
MLPICVATFASAASFVRNRASWIECVSGFSQYTGLPSRSAAAVATACVWSGVLTTTASMSFCSSSLRKSWYFSALGNRPAALAMRSSSISQSATMFSPAR